MGAFSMNKNYNLLILFSYFVISSACADDGRFSLSSGIDFSHGLYGGTVATDVTYMPVIGRYEKNDWLFKLTVPYIRISGPANVTPNIGQIVYPSNAVRTDEGIGDVLFASSYSLINSASRGIVLDVTGKIKFGTADKYTGLGSGTNDYAGELSVYQLQGRLSTFGSLGYKTFGQSAGFSLNNVFYGSVGISGKLSEQFSSGLAVDYRQPTTLTNDSQQILTLFLNDKISKKWRLQTYVFTGKGVSSPNLGGGFMLTERF